MFSTQLVDLLQILLTDPEKLKMMGNVKKPMVVSSRVVCSQRLKRVSIERKIRIVIFNL